VTQEALRNCEKHSKAQRVTVRVEQPSSGLLVEVHDDGIGFQNERRKLASLGVLGMRERAAAVGGAEYRIVRRPRHLGPPLAASE